MSQQIIDDVQELLNLTEEELTEVLLNDKYNKANLRELIRRSFKLTKEYKGAFEYQRTERERLEEKIELIKASLVEL